MLLVDNSVKFMVSDAFSSKTYLLSSSRVISSMMFSSSFAVCSASDQFRQKDY